MRPSLVVVATLCAACGADVAPIVGPPNPSLDVANGAAHPLLHPGQRVMLQGLGFGDQAAGVVEFSAGGGTVEAAADSTEWSDKFIATVVPADAVTGAITVITERGTRLSLSVGIVPRPSFDPATLTWVARIGLPNPAPGVAAAAGQQLDGSTLTTFVVLVGGSAAAESTTVHVGFADASGAIDAWQPRRSVPGRRAHAAVVVATPHTTRRGIGPAIYVIGGVTSAGEASSSVMAAPVSMPDATVGEWVPVASLPEALVAPRAVLANGNIYLTGGTDAGGRPRAATYVARIRADGALEGWFPGPALPAPLAYHGAARLDTLIAVFGGAADTVAQPAELDTLSPRRADAAHTFVSARSGFFTTGTWVNQGPALAAPRSRFASLETGPFVLVVGGLYAGARESLAETLAAVSDGDALAAFAGPVGANTIAGLGGGVLVNPAAVAWHGLDGRAHGLVIGGVDLVTGAVVGGAWGF